MINSSLLSAQNRQRLYWTNIPGVDQPQDKGLVLKDILEYEQNSPVKDTERNRRHYREVDEKFLCMTSTMYKGAGNNGMTLVPIKNPERIKERPNYWQMDVSGKGYNSQQDRIRKLDKPSGTLAAGSASIPNIMCGAFRGRYNEEGKTEQHLEIRKDRMYYRKLTPIECERLQTVPDNYTQGVSNTQRYKMLGNGWTVDVIAHILKNINEENSHTLQTERTPTGDSLWSKKI